MSTIPTGFTSDLRPLCDLCPMTFWSYGHLAAWLSTHPFFGSNVLAPFMPYWHGFDTDCIYLIGLN